jgi:glycosyltransferase involved in cell wall biosynthesis
VRILKVTQAYFPFQDRGGPAVKVRAIAGELVAQGQEVCVLTADLGFGQAQLAAASAHPTAWGWGSKCNGVEAIYLKTKFHYRSLTVNSGLIKFCRKRLRGFDLVHIYGLYDVLGPVVASYCRLFKIPYLVEPLGMTRPIDRGFLLKKLWWRVFSRYLPGATQVIATSEMERDELLADGYSPNRVMLRYNGIDLKEYHDLPPRGTFRKKVGIADDEQFILFLGRIIPRKGADLLIEALNMIRSDKTILVLAGPEGEAGYLSELLEKSKALGVEGRVRFIGPLYGDDKNAAMADAWVFALPSRYENFGNTAVEALACGTPAVVSDRCGVAPLLDGRAGLVTTYDSQALARTFQELLENPVLYQRLKACCGEVAEEISWEHLVRGMQDSYGHARDNFLRRTSV